MCMHCNRIIPERGRAAEEQHLTWVLIENGHLHKVIKTAPQVRHRRAEEEQPHHILYIPVYLGRACLVPVQWQASMSEATASQYSWEFLKTMAQLSDPDIKPVLEQMKKSDKSLLGRKLHLIVRP